MNKSIRRGWNNTILGEVLTFKRGFDITKKQLRHGKYDVIFSSGFGGKHNDYKVKAPGVVIGRKGTLGKVFFAEKNFWATDTTLWVKDFHGNNEKFAYYFLHTMNLEQYDCGSANPTLNRNHIHSLPVSYPPLPTQKKIASILSAYDDLIENNNRRIKILEEMAQTLYQEWFVKFRFPGHEQVKMVESELGLIPEGWEVKKLGDVVELAYGKSLKAKDRQGGEIAVYGSSGVIGYHSQYLVKAPGIIVGRKGNVGKVFWSDTNFYPIDTVYYVQTRVCLYYVYFNLQNQNFINNDAAVPGLNRNQAYSLSFLLPNKDLLNKFQPFVSLIFNQIKQLNQKNNNLEKTRDLLLPKLISGQIDVENLDIDTGEIAA
ncbi:restriction modification system DNA specificity domain protein [Chondrocystis sp. NIES-4102]|nr:restriction modification system DNA specificity domain protein [Chondrocystis sp. NIES-4102]